MRGLKEATAVRFSPIQRVEHVLVMSLFTLLAITGFPQKWYEGGLALAIVKVFGTPERMRFVHRAAGLLFSGLTVFHVGRAVLQVMLGKLRATLVPSRKDFADAVQQIRYDLGLTPERPKFDRFDYRQKFEYWGLLLGGAVMIATGFLLLFPLFFTRFLPGELVPVAKVAHSNEGLMAFLVVITWHIFNAHLAPGIFPYDTSIFTGKITVARLHHEHPLEYERLVAEGTVSGPEPHAAGHAAAPARAAAPDAAAGG